MSGALRDKPMGWHSNFSPRQAMNEPEPPMVPKLDRTNPPATSGAVPTCNCNYKFVFLRREASPSYLRTTTAFSQFETHSIKSVAEYDVYFCERCLEYRKIAVSPVDS